MFRFGAQLEELSDDLSALNNDIRQTKMQVEELFAQSQQSGAVVAETLRTYKKELMDDSKTLASSGNNLTVL